MLFIADLHIHSKYSMATSSDLDLEHLYIAAQYKGIQLVATGDATHPAWFSDLETKLIPAEQGFFVLREEIRKKLDPMIPPSCRGPVRFILSSELSSIYKKDGKVRKNHNLVFFPDMESQKRFNAKLSRIGNIVSDGRPILGLDAKNLLEITLETNPEAFLVPAHIWTPWFSLLGSKSGFDSIEECFEDLTSEIFAVETGLSSDPSMNQRVSFLDPLTLISNSDAHSPGNLGREANLFNTDFHYQAMVKALKEKNSGAFLGTYEFYPEEGKYHLDGHRKCGVSFTPKESLELNGICPVCGKPLTLGVLYRVNELADRPSSFNLETSPKKSFSSLVPLPEILSQILNSGPKTKKVTNFYEKLVSSYGSEFSILFNVDVKDLKNSGIPLMDEAILRVRENRIHVEGGYDGNYGKVEIFSPEERETLMSQKKLFSSADIQREKRVKKTEKENSPFLSEKKMEVKKEDEEDENKDICSGLNTEQKEAVLYTEGPSLILAGPGTGKTRTLTRKISWLANQPGFSASDSIVILKTKNFTRKLVWPAQHTDFSSGILAITFTRKAADEMRERLYHVHGEKLPAEIFTFHGLCFKILEESESTPVIPDDFLSRLLAEKSILKAGLSINTREFKKRIAETRKKLSEGSPCDQEDLKLLHIYREEMAASGIKDFDEIVASCVDLLKKNGEVLANLQKKYKAVFIDEFQDIDSDQYELIRLLAKNLNQITLIGDSNQSVYGFRGGSPLFFDAFKRDWPETKVFHLVRNYRSSTTILDAAWQFLSHGGKSIDPVFKVFSNIEGPEIYVKAAENERREAEWIADTIQKSVGGTGHHVIYAGRDGGGEEVNAFSDIAVLVRTRSQAKVIGDVFAKRGIPFTSADDAPVYENERIKRLFAEFKIVAGLALVSDLVHNPFSLSFKERLVQDLFNENVFLFPYFEKDPRLAALLEKRDTIRKKLLSHDSAELLELLIKDAEKLSHDEAFLAEQIVFAGKGKKYEDFVSEFSLAKEIDLLDFKVEKVRILTLHASKGLEFPVLFLAGCERGLLPYERDERSSIDEERRLFYVGLTRAKNIVWISWAKKRQLFGKMEIREISPFLTELEAFLLEIRDRGKQSGSRKKGKEDQQMRLF